MAIIGLIALATGAAAFAVAKQRQVSTGGSVAAGAVTSVGTGLALTALWYLTPILLLGGAGYYLGKKYMGEQKALPPGSS